MATNNLPVFRFSVKLSTLPILTVNCNTVAIFKTSEGNFKMFDSHSRDSYGIQHLFGKCVRISVEIINNLLMYFQNTVLRGNVTPFESKGLKGVTVQLLTLSGKSAKACVIRTRVPQGHAGGKNKQNFLACEHPYNTLLYVLQA